MQEEVLAKKNEELFEESSQGAVSAITALFLVLSIVLAFGGIILAGYAFGAEVPAIELFCGGLLLSCLGFGLAFNVLPSMGK